MTEALKPDHMATKTDVQEIISNMDAGNLESALSAALSITAAGVIDHAKVGEITLKLKVEKIQGTSQVRLAHNLKFSAPTSVGKRGEETSGATVLHVGKYGKVSVTPENQMSMFGKD